MAKKLLLLGCIVLLGVFFVVLAGEGPADTPTQPVQVDVPAQLKQADKLRAEGHYDQAETVYRQVEAENPGTDHAFAAGRKLTTLYVELGMQGQAQAELEKVLDDFSQHERLPHGVHEITEQSCKMGKGPEAEQLLRSVLANRPQSSTAIWLQMGLAISKVDMGDDEAATDETVALIARFSEHEWIAESIGQIAWAYRKLEKHEQARELYQCVVDNWPDRKRAIFSLRGVVLTSIALKDYRSAEAAGERLLEEFSQDKDMAEVAYSVAEEYRSVREYAKARVFYEYIADNHPDSKQAFQSQTKAVLICIALEDYAAASAAADKLIERFSADPGIAEALYSVATRLDDAESGREKAGELYQYVARNHPGSDSAILAEAKTGTILLWQGDIDSAQAVFDRLLTDFASHPVLPKAVAIMGDGYYNQAVLLDSMELHGGAEWFYRKAIAECERVVTQFPEIPRTTAECCYFWAVCHERIREHADAINRYQVLLDKWPDYKYAWNALFHIGRCYQELNKSGLISKSEADLNIQAAYERLIQEYPNCQVAGYVRRCLGRPDPANKGERR